MTTLLLLLLSNHTGRRSTTRKKEIKIVLLQASRKKGSNVMDVCEFMRKRQETVDCKTRCRWSESNERKRKEERRERALVGGKGVRPFRLMSKVRKEEEREHKRRGEKEKREAERVGSSEKREKENE